jgi:hypothetical protein
VPVTTLVAFKKGKKHKKVGVAMELDAESYIPDDDFMLESCNFPECLEHVDRRNQ